jgi:hypothetical protein
MPIFGKISISVAAAYAILLFLLIDLIFYQQPHLHFTAEAGEGGPCIDYGQTENTITINCNASFLDVVQTMNDPDIVENIGDNSFWENTDKWGKDNILGCI